MDAARVSSENPWDKYAKAGSETVLRAHGLEFVITTAAAAAYCQSTGMAQFSYDEIRMLQTAAGDAKLPKELSEALHRVKRIIGGRIIDAKSLAV
jgi:hypothetical protein